MSQVWPKFFQEFSRYLPLTSVIWKSPFSSKPAKTIDSILIDFKPFSNDLFTRKTVLTSHLLPSCHLFIVSCDDSETYKTIIRKQIKDWLEMVNRKKVQECVIIHVCSQEQPKITKFSVNLKSSVYDKIKSDFGSKTNRCCQIPLADNDPSDWYDLLMKLKDAVITSFSLIITSIDEEIRKMDSLRLNPGWNYGSFFLVKESMALVYESIGLQEEALEQYEELEAIFYHVHGPGTSTVAFNNFGASEVGDEVGNILDFSQKPYRDFILQNNISIFDFRIYLFARQAYLLNSMGKIALIYDKGRILISTLFKNQVYCYFNVKNSEIAQQWKFNACRKILYRFSEYEAGNPEEASNLAIARVELIIFLRKLVIKFLIQDSNCSCSIRKSIHYRIQFYYWHHK